MRFLHSVRCSQSHIASDCHSAAATATAAKAVSQARFVGEVKTFIRLNDRVQSLFVQKLASCSRYIRWLNNRYYLPLWMSCIDSSSGIISKCF